jgi:uncharacterized protein GlcG (DUF336 family)
VTPYDTDQLIAALRAAHDEADRRHSPSGICIVDDGGHVLLHARHPDAPLAAADSALSKARTAVWLGADTGGLPAESPVVPALTAAVPWPVNVFPGGLVLRQGRRVVGAVGVGGHPDPSVDRAIAETAHAVLRSGDTPS